MIVINLMKLVLILGSTVLAQDSLSFSSRKP
jgi:hypothetical protein